MTNQRPRQLSFPLNDSPDRVAATASPPSPYVEYSRPNQENK